MNERDHALQMQFEDLGQQRRSDLLGMWIFIATEVLFFGALFFIYAVYRWQEPRLFTAASQHLNLAAGSINTLVLLTSSLTVAVADHAIAVRRCRLARGLLLVTLALGLVFLGIKGYEYRQEYRHGLIPFVNPVFHWTGEEPAAAQRFFNLYFTMTALHAVHLVIGCGLVAVLAGLCRPCANPERLQMQLRTGALYWHFVDVVWVFLFPLFYLVR